MLLHSPATRWQRRFLNETFPQQNCNKKRFIHHISSFALSAICSWKKPCAMFWFGVRQGVTILRDDRSVPNWSKVMWSTPVRVLSRCVLLHVSVSLCVCLLTHVMLLSATCLFCFLSYCCRATKILTTNKKVPSQLCLYCLSVVFNNVISMFCFFKINVIFSYLF